MLVRSSPLWRLLVALCVARWKRTASCWPCSRYGYTWPWVVWGFSKSKAKEISLAFVCLLFPYAGSLFKSSSFQVRIVVIELLFVMLGIPMLASNISRQLVNSYDSKSPNEKCRIIRHHSAIHDANADAWTELKRKALNDSCSIPGCLLKRCFREI